MKICIDSNVFIHGIKRNTGQDDLIEKAEYFFEWVQEEKHEIIIPTVVIAEILAPEPLEKYPVYMDIINRSFIVSDFDSRAATQYGILLMNKIEEVKKIADEKGIPKNRVKVDHQIIACAIIHGADRILTNDVGLMTFGNTHIEIKYLKDLVLPAKQGSLFPKTN